MVGGDLYVDTSDESEENPERIAAWKRAWPTPAEARDRDARPASGLADEDETKRDEAGEPERGEADEPERDEADEPERDEADEPERDEADEPVHDEADEPERDEGDESEGDERDESEREEGDEPESDIEDESARDPAELFAALAANIKDFRALYAEARGAVPTLWQTDALLKTEANAVITEAKAAKKASADALEALQIRLDALIERATIVRDSALVSWAELEKWASVHNSDPVKDLVSGIKLALSASNVKAASIASAVEALAAHRIEVDKAEAAFAEATETDRDAYEVFNQRFKDAQRILTNKVIDRLNGTWRDNFKVASSDLRDMLRSEDAFVKSDVVARLRTQRIIVEGLEEAVAAEEEKAAKAERARFADADRLSYAGFNRADSSTWDIARIQTARGVDLSQVNRFPADQTLLDRIAAGDLSDRSTASTASLNHCHMIGGTGGIAFTYNHLGGNRVQPVIYDYATNRKGKTGNKYVWKLKQVTQSGPPPVPSFVSSDRGAPK